MKIGICADHGGFVLKESIRALLVKMEHEVTDFGAYKLNDQDDFPDFVIPLAQAVASHEVERAIAICGSGVGACVAANKVRGVRAGLVHDYFSAHQGVEDDDMNLICMGGRVIGFATAQELVQSFLKAKFIGGERHLRRLKKIEALEK
jgi:ribose 5-phosphate isomerase B